MTPLGWLGRKSVTQRNKHSLLPSYSSVSFFPLIYWSPTPFLPVSGDDTKKAHQGYVVKQELKHDPFSRGGRAGEDTLYSVSSKDLDQFGHPFYLTDTCWETVLILWNLLANSKGRYQIDLELQILSYFPFLGPRFKVNWYKWRFSLSIYFKSETTFVPVCFLVNQDLSVRRMYSIRK